MYMRSRIIWLGDLNYRISLPGSTTRLLVEQKEWKVLLENDQVFVNTCSISNKIKILMIKSSDLFTHNLRSYVGRFWKVELSKVGARVLSNSPLLTNIIRTPTNITGAFKAKKARKSAHLHGNY